MPKSRDKNPPLCIEACDATGGWNLNQYSPQQGHTICFKTNLCDADIEKIIWTFSDKTAEPSTEKRMCRVFTKEISGVRVPCEGVVTVFVAVTKNNKCVTACRKILLVPVVNCQLEFCDDYHIKGDTQCIKANVQGLCEALSVGNPIDGVDGYACGGACLDRCPEYEIRMNPPHETCIFSYGRHCSWAEVGICQVLCEPPPVCVPLYANNFLGEHARYPPAKVCFCIVPRNLTLQVFHTPG